MQFRDPRLANVSPHATCPSGRHSRARLRSGPGPGRLRPGGRHVRAGPGDQRRNPGHQHRHPGHQHRHPDRQHTLPVGVLASDQSPGYLVTVASLRAGPLLAPVGSHGAPLPGLRSTGPDLGGAAIRALSQYQNRAVDVIDHGPAGSAASKADADAAALGIATYGQVRLHSGVLRHGPVVNSDLHAVCTRPPCRLHTSRLSCCSRQMTGLTSSRCAVSGLLRKAEERRCPERQRREGAPSTTAACR